LVFAQNWIVRFPHLPLRQTRRKPRRRRGQLFISPAGCANNINRSAILSARILPTRDGGSMTTWLPAGANTILPCRKAQCT